MFGGLERVFQPPNRPSTAGQLYRWAAFRKVVQYGTLDQRDGVAPTCGILRGAESWFIAIALLFSWVSSR